VKLAWKNIESFVKNPPAAALAVLVYGPDEGLVRERATALTRHVVPDPKDPFGIAEIPAGELADNPAKLLDEAQSISMLGGRRVVRVRDATDKTTAAAKAALKALKPGDNLVLIEAAELGPRSSLRLLFEEAENAAALPCYIDDARDLTRILAEAFKEQGFLIPSEALSYMAANVVGDRGVARAEAEKLMIYMGKSRSIALEDVTACLGSSAVLPLDDLARTAASGNFAEADRILRHLLAEGESAVRILRVLQDYFSRLYVTKARLAKGEDLELALKKLKPPLFFKHKDAFTAQLRGWSAAQIEQAISLLMSVEGKCKQTGAEEGTLCGRAVLSLSQTGAKAVQQRRRA
jgi:DNA polymerase III subunit delta